MFPKIALNKLIILKLLHDALLILVVLFFGLLLMESVLPGLVSGHLGLGIMAGLILIIAGLINWLAEKLAITNPLAEIKVSKPPHPQTCAWGLGGNLLSDRCGCGGKKEVFIILLVFFIFIFNSVLRIDWILGAIISLLASLAGLLVFFFVQKAD